MDVIVQLLLRKQLAGEVLWFNSLVQKRSFVWWFGSAADWSPDSGCGGPLLALEEGVSSAQGTLSGTQQSCPQGTWSLFGWTRSSSRLPAAHTCTPGVFSNAYVPVCTVFLLAIIFFILIKSSPLAGGKEKLQT